ncbi:MAG: nitrate reductase [Pseudomonadota bacterium]
MREVKTTCPYCGVGCGVQAKLDAEQLIAVEGDREHPANRGKLCVKGSHLADTLVPQGRLSQPHVDGQAVSWKQATHAVASRLQQTIDAHGPDAVAFYLSGQLLTEDYYVANKLMKGFVGSANVDTNSRLCMASAVVAHNRAFGEDIVACDYADLESCDLLILCGSNTAWAHPVIYQRIVQARKSRDIYVVVIDPRRTSTCEIADLHLAIQPGTDAALFNGLFTYLAEHGADREFVNDSTSGIDLALAENQCSLEEVEGITAVPQHVLLGFYQRFAATPKTVTMYSQGINQAVNGVDRANAIINCHLITGRIGKPGMGPFSITGQPNAMGGREVGGLANQLAAHMGFDAHSVGVVSEFWGSDRVAAKPGLKAVDMFQAVARGDIKAIWIMGTNPAVSLPDSDKVRQALADCPLVIVSDCMAQTDTSRLADILLPAQGWSEKDGTVTNSERCISRQRRFVAPPVNVRPDWQIICDVACAMGYTNAFAYQAPWQIFAEHVALTSWRNAGSRLLDLNFLAPITADSYADMAPISWPVERPFAQGRFATSDGRAQFLATPHIAPVQAVTEKFPLILNSGRLRDQWHTMTRTGLAPRLWLHKPAAQVQINPRDAAQRKIEQDDLLEVYGEHGQLRMLADVTDAIAPGQLFAPIHFNREFSNAGLVGSLLQPVVDPLSGQPESKHGAVDCRRLLTAAWARLLTGQDFDPQALHGLPGLEYWLAIPDGDHLKIELAVTAMEPLLELLNAGAAVQFEGLNGTRRYLGEGWMMFAETLRSALPDWDHLREQWQASVPGWQKLSVQQIGERDVTPVVCSCFEVRRSRIEAAIRDGVSSVEALGEALACGTNCGSCIPELTQMLYALQSIRKVAS